MKQLAIRFHNKVTMAKMPWYFKYNEKKSTKDNMIFDVHPLYRAWCLIRAMFYSIERKLFTKK